MIYIRPETIAKPLIDGDEVSLIACSSSVINNESLIKGIKILESWGLSCREYNFIGREWGYFAGTEEERFKELHDEKTAPLLAAARGGWGASRLLEKDQPWKPGWLLGYSDVTSLLLSRLSAGFDGAIHGPLITSLGSEPLWSQERLRSFLFGLPLPDLQGEGWQPGTAKGPIVAGNLTVLTHLLGSDHIPNMAGAILVLEDIGEEPYRIDRMLTQLRLAGILKQISGLAFGQFKSCKNLEKSSIEKTFSLKEVLKDRSKDLNIPVIANLPIGHCQGNACLPMGHIAELNGTKGTLKMTPFSK